MTNTTATTKFTKKMDFTAIIEILNADKSCEVIDPATADRLIARMKHEIELLDKKNASDRKPTKTQVANSALGQKILDTMEENTLYTISQILKMLDDEALNQSKVSAVVRGMLIKTANGVENPNGTIERIMEKGTAYFKKIATLDESED